MAKRQNEIRKFIIDKLEEHSGDILSFAANTFQVSKSAISQHISSLIEEGIIEATGKGRNRQFSFKKNEIQLTEKITPGLLEDRIWTNKIVPVLPQLSPNVFEICQYGFTEMFNNVIDHSTTKDAVVLIIFDIKSIEIRIMDFGVGIFKNIKAKLHLEDEIHAVIELSKGKLTTDPEKHSGEGIFFTSRAFNNFTIISGGLHYAHHAGENDWLIDSGDNLEGTLVSMEISLKSERTLKSVFESFAGESQGFHFDKTIVAVALSQFASGNLVSRSQAKRLLNRIENFKEVIFDFAKVDFIGRAFADEIFRVYKNQHPNIALSYINAGKQVEGVIESILNVNSKDAE